MPKIYMTKLPIEAIKKEPEIFFTKLLKEKHKSVAVVENVERRTMGAKLSGVSFEEITLYSDDKDNIVISEDSLEHAERSDQVYQDGLENLNARIYNGQEVHHPENGFTSFNEKKQFETHWASFPLLENVSSTALMTGDRSWEDIDQENQTTLPSQTSLNGADKVERSSLANIAIFGFLRDEDWVLPIIILAPLTLVIILSYSVFAYVKRKSSDRHQFSDQMLMLGIVSCVLVSCLYTLQPTPAICGVIRAGSGLSYTLVYSALLLKLVFLVSLNNGIYIPASYLTLFLFFAILIQIVIVIQWLVAVPPQVSALTCAVSFQQQLHGQIYNMFLITVLTMLSLKYRGLRPAYREAHYISITMVLTVMVWATWIAAGYIVPPNYKDLCSSAGLLASAITTFSAMVLPWGRQLATAGKEDAYSEKRRNDRRRKNAVPVPSKTSLHSVRRGFVQLCIPVKNWFMKKNGEENEVPNAVVRSFVNKTSVCQRNKHISAHSSSRIDGTIYSLADDLSEEQISSKTRSETMDS